MFVWMLAAALPGLFWEQGPQTASALKTAGIECVHVAPAQADSWKAAGACATTADLAGYIKLPQPGVEFRPDVATATRAPWVNSNGWRLARAAGKPVFYNAAKGQPDLCAAEAFAYDTQALVRVDAADLERFASMLRFLKGVDSPALPPRANIGFVDDGSAEAGEVINLMTRRNLLFRIVTAPDPRLDLNVRIGAPEYPRAAASNPSEFVAMIRQKLTDSKRLLRIYGSEVVIGRLTGDGSRARLHLLNYGGKKVEGLRVRLLGVYKNVQISTLGGAGSIGDLVAADGATEFSLPTLDAYAIVDLR
jgi:hypothetical protein